MVLAVCASDVMAQRGRHSEPRFDFTTLAGLSMSQIDGDGAGSYNLFGYHLGVNTTFPLSEDADSPIRMLVEVGLIQKGSRIPSIDRKIKLTYAELPLALTYAMRMGDDNQLRVGVGVAPAFLADATVLDYGSVENEEQERNYRSFDRLPLMLDAQVRFGEHLGVFVRYYNSMLPVTLVSGTGTYRIFRSNMGVFNRNMIAGISYRF